VKAGDKIERAHHRHVRSCRLEGGPETLAPDGPAALKIVIVGDSFMLHQIRWVEWLFDFRM
jgi:tRNA U38,U39,U40 pseudouridine synthase TruA